MKSVIIPEDQFLVTATAAGRVLGLSAAAVVALANRGKLPCVRDSSNRRMFSGRDLTTLKKARARETPRRRSKAA